MTSKEQAIYSSSGRRVKFDSAFYDNDDDDDTSNVYYDADEPTSMQVVMVAAPQQQQPPPPVVKSRPNKKRFGASDKKIVATVPQPATPPRTYHHQTKAPSASHFVVTPSSPARKKVPKERRSWSPLRRSRRHGNPNAPPPQPTEDASIAPSLSNNNNNNSLLNMSLDYSLAGSSLASTAYDNDNATPKRRNRRYWFSSSRSKSPQKKRQSQRGRSLTAVRENNKNNHETHHDLVVATSAPPDDDQALHKETQKLVRSLTGASVQPLSADTVQEAYLAALDLQEETKQLRQQHANSVAPPDNDDDDTAQQRELQDAKTRIQQLHMELKAAQKAASQLATRNLVYEEQQKTLIQELELARARIEELEQADQDGDDTFREQLEMAKRTMGQLQQENEKLKLAARRRQEEDESISEYGSPYENVNDSFELQLRLQKELAKVMARVHRLEEENNQYAEKQQEMHNVLEQVKILQDVNQTLLRENAQLKDDLETSKAETAKAVSAAKAAPSHKDMVLSSSQLATATTIIGRLTEECKTLNNREKELKAKLKRLTAKNKNQKEIFSTALEIKQIELKIYEQESRMNARKVEELNQTITQYQTSSSSVETLSATPPEAETASRTAVATPEDPGVVSELRNRLQETEDRLRETDSANQDLEDKIESLQEELNERRVRVAELEEMLEKQTEQSKTDIQLETITLSNKVLELSSLVQRKEDELMTIHAELEDERKESEYRTQVRVNELTEQLHEYEASLEEREERIHELQSKVSEQEEEIAKSKTSQQSERSVDVDDEGSQHSSRLESIRRKMGTYEGLMRAKMSRIREMEKNNEIGQQSNRSLPTTASSSRVDSPPLPMVFASPVPETRANEMETALKASNEQIMELKAKLADAQLRLAHAKETAEAESRHRFDDMEASLQHSADRINDLEQQLDKAHYHIGQLHQSRDADRKEFENQMNVLSKKHDTDKARLVEMEQSLQESGEEVLRLQDLVQEMDTKIEELQPDHTDVARDESTCDSLKDQATMSALEEELEDVRQRYDDECDKYEALAVKAEQIEKDRSNAMRRLQQAEFELIEKQNNFDELVVELETAKTSLAELQEMAQKKESLPDDRITRLEAALLDALDQVAQADVKIEMLEQFIEEETSGGVSSSSNINQTSSMQAEADIKRKDEEMQILREDYERTRKDLLRSKERIENLEMERNYSTAKLKELSSIVKTKAGTEAEVQLYNKCIECAELSANQDDLSNKLRSSQAVVKQLEQEISATRQMVNEVSQSWDSAASADENISRLKREHGESVARATTLSIQLAESQMQIDKLSEKLTSAERSNKAYAEELSSRSGIFQAMTRSRSSSRHSSPERRDENIEMRRLKQRIALLEDQNAAYEASLHAFSSLHENMQKGR